MALSALAAGYVLFCFPPEQSGFYPRCMVYTWLHLLCPGCGGTRALAAVLHGRLDEALHWNAMLVLLLPFLAIFLSASYLRAIRSSTFAWPRVPVPAVKLSILLAALFTVARNLHWH